MMFKSKLMLAGLFALAMCTQAQAQWAVACVNCSTTWTQLAQQGLQVKDLASQAEQYAMQVQQYTTMVRNLARLDPSTVARIMGPGSENMQATMLALKNSYQAGMQTYYAANNVYRDYQQLQALKTGNATPTQVLYALKNIALQKGGDAERIMKQRESDQTQLQNAAQAIADANAAMDVAGGNVESIRALGTQVGNQATVSLQTLSALKDMANRQREVEARNQLERDANLTRMANLSAALDKMRTARDAAIPPVTDQPAVTP